MSSSASDLSSPTLCSELSSHTTVELHTISLNRISGMFLLALLILMELNFNSLSLDTRLNWQWNEFKNTYGKAYKNKEQELFHRRIWEKNLLEISMHNLKFFLGTESYSMKMNRMGDWEKHQESDMDLDLSSAFSKKKKKIPKKNETELPKAVDWRIKGYVTEVRDQGNCGSCWAFNAVGALEALIKKQTKILVPLSIQQLVDCSLEGEGCDGGSAEEAFKYVIKHGITLDSSYGYTGKEGYCYQNDAESTLFPCSDFVEIPFNDELALKEAVARIGPISVAIDISPKRFRFYHTAGALNLEKMAIFE
ncbi:cathepsin S-like isoform X2 [Polypterus senegalus]|uniref:cathepsin S-like isoform X2 n=1 Tax=Polypterus senegalus TaxID=55291 RepID=UPI0019669391|nr:cathepsin S-like isoform X2 [Polypterus senegalus]